MTFAGWEGRRSYPATCSSGSGITKTRTRRRTRAAFIVNRIGDFGLLASVCCLRWWARSSTPDFGGIAGRLMTPWWMGWPAGYWITLLLFVGCRGKSAQIPAVCIGSGRDGWTHAGFGPIHAATMVTGCVYVVCAPHDLRHRSRKPPDTVAGVAHWLWFAATIGIVQRDFKKVLAYSTVDRSGSCSLASVRRYTAGGST